MGAIHLPHSSATKRRNNLVRTDALRDGRRLKRVGPDFRIAQALQVRSKLTNVRIPQIRPQLLA